MEQEKQHGIGLEVHAPGQFWAKVTGGDVKGLLIVIIILMATGSLFLQAQENTRLFLEQHKITQSNQIQIINQLANTNKLISDGQEKQTRAQTVQTYVLTLSDYERKALRLQEPEELRNKRR